MKICRICDGTGESRTGRAGEGHCWYCHGRGVVPTLCAQCGKDVEELDDNELCANCRDEKEDQQ